MCHMIFFILFYFRQIGEAYQWRVCYPRGLPRLGFGHVTCEKEQGTHNLGHITRYTQGVVNIVSQFQVPCSNGL